MRREDERQVSRVRCSNGGSGLCTFLVQIELHNCRNTLLPKARFSGRRLGGRWQSYYGFKGMLMSLISMDWEDGTDGM